MNYNSPVCVLVLCLLIVGKALRLGSGLTTFRTCISGASSDVESIEYNELNPGESVDVPRVLRTTTLKQLSAVTLTSLLSLSLCAMADDWSPALSAVRPQSALKMKRTVRPLAYSVEMTDPPCLQPRSSKGEDSALRRLAASDVLLFGLHDSAPFGRVDEDVELTLRLLQRMLKTLPRGEEVSLGISDIPRTAANMEAIQSYLKSTNEGILPAELSQWLPILQFAKASKLEVAPMGLPETVVQTVCASGLQGLDESQKSDFVPDAEGFLQSVLGEGFKRYSDKVIIARYEQDSTRRQFKSVENYFSYRILQQEYAANLLAQRAFGATANKGSALTILLAPESDIKFGLGVEERVKRNLNRLRGAPSSSSEVYSVLLNPTADDSLSDTAQLQLVLAYGPFLKYQRPLADFLWFSDYPPVRILTRTKNPIDREGDKPMGESSILGAF